LGVNDVLPFQCADYTLLMTTNFHVFLLEGSGFESLL
jgi:hypothetical protein